MDFNMMKKGSSGVAKAGLTTGIIGTALGVLNSAGGLGALALGSQPKTTVVDPTVVWPYASMMNPNACCCNEDHTVNRYELSLQQKNAEKDSVIALRDANTYNDQKMLEMYKYIDGRFREFETQLARQAVQNQKTEDMFTMVADKLQCCCDKLNARIDNECRERRCADNSLVTYVNTTFYPKSVANVTVGTEMTPQSLFNPLPQSNCGGCCNN